MSLERVLETTEMVEVAGGFLFTEGPVWDSAGCCLLFSDIPADTIYRQVSGAEAKAFRKPSHNSNGLTFDRQGRLIACEHGARRVSRGEADGSVTALATHYQGKRLNSPNDVVVRSDGVIFFTDPPYGIKPEDQEQPCNGVYCLAPDGSLTLLVDDFDRPNGLAFSPDEKTIYIADTSRLQVRAFDVAADGALSNGRLFAEMESELEGGPDGMKVDVEGNLYSSGPGGVWIYRPDGELLGVAAAPQLPANLAFGGTDYRTLFITARSTVYALRTRVEGIRCF